MLTVSLSRGHECLVFKIGGEVLVNVLGKGLYMLSRPPYRSVKACLSKSDLVALEEALAVVSQGDDDTKDLFQPILRGVFYWEDLPSGVICAIWEARGDEVSHEVAQHRNTPADILTELWDEGDESLWTALAGNPNTPESILWDLWEAKGDDPDPYVYELARNPSSPSDLLYRLYDMVAPPLRRVIRNNSSAPQWIREDV